MVSEPRVSCSYEDLGKGGSMFLERKGELGTQTNLAGVSYAQRKMVAKKNRSTNTSLVSFYCIFYSKISQS